MDIRHWLMNLTYPLVMGFNKITRFRRKTFSSDVPAPSSFFELSMTDSRGGSFHFSGLKGKKTLIVNTASHCGYTAQYGELQYLYSTEQDQLQVIAFPTGDFMDQELDDDDSIRIFCSKYRVAFPLMQKSHVKRGADQNPVFRWLTDPAANGWNKFQPSWNFCKYLVDENGNLTHIFESGVAPEEVRKYV